MRAWRWVVAGGVIAIVLVVLLARDDRPRAVTRAPIPAATSRPAAHAEKVRPRPPVGGLRLEGQVIDERDRPVAGALVRFYNFEGGTTTAEDGSFVFENLGPHDYKVVAEASEDTWCEMVEVALAATSEPVILRVIAGATATVHVVDAEGGKPIAGARLHDTVTDANGDVKLRGLRPGGNHILITSVEADGYERARAKITDLDLGNPSENVFVVAMRRGVVVSGVVTGPNGERVTAGEVTASVDGRTRSDTDVDETGAWQLTLAAGTFELTASWDGRESAAQTLELDGTQARGGIVLRLPAGKPVATSVAVVEGVVVDERGVEVAGAEVTVESSVIRSDGRGRFRVTLQVGATTVTASARKGELASGETTESIAGPRVELRLVIGPSTIAGRVVDRRGRPAPGVRVSVRDSVSTLSDDKGRFELRGLVPGDHPVFVAPVDLQYSRAMQGVVASTGDRDVQLVVEYTGGVTGRVVLDGKPVSYFGAFVDDGLDQPVLVRAADGRFAIRGVVAGTWRIVIAGPSFGRKVLSGVVVPENDDLDLGDVAVERGRSLRGRVTDASGAGVGGATVIVHEPLDRPRDSIARAVQGTGAATTDASGAYRIDNLSPSLFAQRRHIIATHPTRGVSIERPLGDGETEVNLVIAKPGGIDGRIEGIDSGVLCVRVDDGENGFVFGASPDAAGRFRFDDLAPGRYRLRPNRLAAEVAIVTVVSGQRAKVALVVPAERIEVTIAATACTSVTLATADGNDLVADAACAIQDVPPGAYRACADGRCRAIEVRSQPAKQSFTLRP